MPADPATAPAQTERARHNLRFGIAALAYGFTAALLLLADRSGASEQLVAWLALGVAAVGMAATGILGRTMQMSRFFGMNANIAPPLAGLACAALTFGLALPVMPGLGASPDMAAESVVLLGACAAGLALGALAIWPLLRANRAYSLADLLAARFGSGAVRFLTASVAALVSALVAQAGFQFALQAVIGATGIAAPAAAALLATVLACVCVPGGLRGAFGAALTAGGLLLLALGGAVLYLYAGGHVLQMFSLSGPDSSAGFAYAAGGATQSGHFSLALTAALGLATLPPMALCGLACASHGQARRAGAGAILWFTAFLVAVAALTAFGAARLAVLLAGKSPPQWLFESGPGGALLFCGQTAASLAAALKACAADPGFSGALQLSDIRAGSAWLLLTLPRFTGANPAVRGLAAAGGAAVGLSVAAMGIQSLAAAIGHDALYRRGGMPLLTSARLALTRLVMLGAVPAAALAALALSPDPRSTLGFAVALSAAALGPLLFLAFWPRATGPHAAAALMAGMACFAIALARAGLAASLGQMADAASVGMAAALLTGLCLGLTTRVKPETRQAAHGLRHGALKALRQRPGA